MNTYQTCYNTITIYLFPYRIIKISSPNINNIIGLSGLFSFAAIIALTIDINQYESSSSLAIAHCWVKAYSIQCFIIYSLEELIKSKLPFQDTLSEMIFDRS